MDNIDQRILNELEANGRLSIVELAARVNLTNTPCSERVKRLEKNGYIKGYSAIVDKERIGLALLTVVQVSLTATAEQSLEKFNEAVRNVPEIESCLMVAGS
ncbi:winged helix-turn-helix transcriptional regulator, partial [uncultured Ruegeria sp.]